MSRPATRVAFDTVVLLQAGGNPRGPAGACLRMAVEGLLTLHMSIDGLQELHDVLERDVVRSRFPLLTDEGVERFLEGWRETAFLAPQVPTLFHYRRDPDDEHILNLAIACEVRFLLTQDKDLLDLMSARNAEGEALEMLAPRLTILPPPDFLRVWREMNDGPGILPDG